jgi:hypothetical protein
MLAPANYIGANIFVVFFFNLIKEMKNIIPFLSIYAAAFLLYVLYIQPIGFFREEIFLLKTPRNRRLPSQAQRFRRSPQRLGRSASDQRALRKKINY